jgi:pimeloyl-ACP methyl ester carboxylesterase
MVAATAGSTRGDCFVAIAGMDLHAGLVAAAEVPVTVVVGARDKLTPPRLARRIADAIPGSELLIIPDAGHQLPFEEPDLLAELMSAAARPTVSGAASSAIAASAASPT